MGVENRSALRHAVGLATVIALATLAEAARAVPRESDAQRADARTSFDQGVKQAAAGNWRAALASFRAAHEKSPHFRVLYNIGQLCVRIGDAACAVNAYDRYLREGGAEIPAARREAVEHELEALSSTLGTIRILTSVKGAGLLVDDVSIGKTPIAKPVAASGGAHVIRLVYGDKVVEERVKVVIGQSTTVTLEVPKPTVTQPAPPPAEPPPAEPPPMPEAQDRDRPPAALPQSAHESRRFPVISWALTGTLAAATTVTGVLAARSYSSFERKRDTYPVSGEELGAAQESARDLLLLTSGLGVATVIAAGFAVYFTFSSTSRVPPSADPRLPSTGVTPSPTTGGVQRVGIAAGPRGLTVVGVWQ